MSAYGQLRKISLQLSSLTSSPVGSQMKGNLVTASAAPSVNVPSLSVERPPLIPSLNKASAVPGDATGRISPIPPTSYRPTTIPSLSLGSEKQLKNIGKKSLSFLKSTFFSPEPASTESNT